MFERFLSSSFVRWKDTAHAHPAKSASPAWRPGSGRVLTVPILRNRSYRTFTAGGWGMAGGGLASLTSALLVGRLCRLHSQGFFVVFAGHRCNPAFYWAWASNVHRPLASLPALSIARSPLSCCSPWLPSPSSGPAFPTVLGVPSGSRRAGRNFWCSLGSGGPRASVGMSVSPACCEGRSGLLSFPSRCFHARLPRLPASEC